MRIGGKFGYLLAVIACLTFGNASLAEQNTQSSESHYILAEALAHGEDEHEHAHGQEEHSHAEATENESGVEQEEVAHEEGLGEEHAEHGEAHGAEHGAGHGEEHGDGGHHDSGTTPLFFIILAVIIGAAVRHFFQKSPLPFTVLLLLIGLGLGVMARVGLFEHWNIGIADLDVSFINNSITWAANIDPHLLLYVFLPILIFEAAFAMDVHTFKKSVTNAVLLAVPGIVIALVLTALSALFMRDAGIGLSSWTWSISLMFGAVISATDPVAVVALLKELGASKKLGTLIEGESLLNDGTAIVIFMVFFTAITGTASGTNPILEFGRVSFGGAFIGIAVGWIVLTWIKRVFNDAMVEISVVVAAAYLTFLVAEHFFHVSGVLALVAFGLVMAGVGRSRISPQVAHFMHEFWELAGFIANCIIFLIVGVVIAQRSEISGSNFIVLGIVYVVIHVVRAIVILLLYPFMRKAGYGLPKKDAIIVWYGALRGAIGLALALIVAGTPYSTALAEMGVSEAGWEEIKDQFLFVTAGIVTLTLLVNATTVGSIVNALGLTKVAPARVKMMLNAKSLLRQTSETHMSKISGDRYMKRANWDTVTGYLPDEVDAKKMSEVENAEIQAIAETRRRILEKEKSSYWSQFGEGLLGPTAVRRLSDGISEILDAGGMIPLSARNDLEEQWETPKLLARMMKWPIVGRWAEKTFYDRLTISYDCAVGFVLAQDELLQLVKSMSRGATSDDEVRDLEIIEEEINENKIHGQSFIRNLRKNYSDIYNAISTRQAVRAMLSFEKLSIDKLQKKGQIDGGEAEKMKTSLQIRTKNLIDNPPRIEHDVKKKRKKDKHAAERVEKVIAQEKAEHKAEAAAERAAKASEEPPAAPEAPKEAPAAPSNGETKAPEPPPAAPSSEGEKPAES